MNNALLYRGRSEMVLNAQVDRNTRQMKKEIPQILYEAVRVRVQTPLQLQCGISWLSDLRVSKFGKARI